MRAFAAILRVSLRQLLGSKRVILMGLIALLPAIVMFGLSRNRSAGRMFTDFHEAPLIILFLFVLPLTSLLVGSVVLGDERRDGTLSFLVLRPLPRETIVTAKLAAAWGAAWLVIGGGGLAAAAVYGLASGDWSVLAPVLVSTAVSTLAYAAVFMLLGYLTRWAVLIGAGFLFFWEVGITNAADSLANISLFRIGITGYASMLPGAEPLLREPLAALQPGLGGAIAKVAVIGASAVIIVAALIRRRDVA